VCTQNDPCIHAMRSKYVELESQWTRMTGIQEAKRKTPYTCFMGSSDVPLSKANERHSTNKSRRDNTCEHLIFSTVALFNDEFFRISQAPLAYIRAQCWRREESRGTQEQMQRPRASLDKTDEQQERALLCTMNSIARIRRPQCVRSHEDFRRSRFEF
jgi:hypothetical protein